MADLLGQGQIVPGAPVVQTFQQFREAKSAAGEKPAQPNALTADAVKPVTTEEYYANAEGPIAPRPHYSTLSLDRLEKAGFTPRDWEDELAEYLETLPR